MDHPTRFWSTLRRRGWLIGLLTIAFLCASIIVAYSMTPIFRSDGKILVEQGDIPADVIPTTVRGLVEERIELVSADRPDRR